MPNTTLGNKARSNLDALVGFLPDLQKIGFKPGTWVGPENGAGGGSTMPYTNHSNTVRAFVQATYRHDWVRSDFDWPDWARSQEARELKDDDAVLCGASCEQLARLLTVCIRQDRFSEGALLAAFNSGLILRIVLRAQAILGELDSA